MKTSKKRVVAFVLGAMVLLGLPFSGGWGGDNSRQARDPVADMGWETGLRYVVRFTTTTSSANTQVCVVSTATAGNLQVPTNVSFNPTITSSTSTTYGGRGYLRMQAISAASNVYVDFDTIYLSTTTSPYFTQGQFFSPDVPMNYQGPVCLQSPSTFTVSGWIVFQRPRP